MKPMRLRFLLPLLLLFLMWSGCKPDISLPAASHGTANFSSYVAVGNSLTSGYSSGALSRNGQLNSYPAMLAAQMKEAGGGNFKLPLLQEGNGNNGSGVPMLTLSIVNGTLAPVPDIPATPLDNISSAGPYNDVAVPGARSVDMMQPEYSLLNPFLERFCQKPGTSTIISEAMRNNPTFFTAWIGNNDVLGYAISGGIGKVAPPIPYPDDITDTAQFRAALLAAVTELTSAGAKGVLANIPDVVTIPFFTTIPYNALVLSAGQATQLNLAFSSLPTVHFQAGANPFVVVDPQAPGGFRQMVQGEIVLLPDLPAIEGAGYGSIIPLTDSMYLNATEINNIHNYTGWYNEIISSIVQQFGLGLVDMNNYLKVIQPGIIYNGESLGATYITGGAFSLDGVHPTDKGYALIANQYISVINAKFAAHLSYVDVTQYKGLLFP
jgi:lysophospholipase L1-like esterase